MKGADVFSQANYPDVTAYSMYERDRHNLDDVASIKTE